jgi:four helix bundle protein
MRVDRGFAQVQGTAGRKRRRRRRRRRENDPVFGFLTALSLVERLSWTMLSHERFEAWRLCHELVLAVYRTTASWPTHERYGLTSQIRRAAVSAAANIAEGAAKRGSREFRRYLDIALGSLAETSYLLMLAKDLTLISPEDWATLDGLRKRAGGLTWRLARSLQVSA